jgi:hypothetical protein
VEDQAPAGRGRVERLVQRGESDAALAQAGHDRDEVLDGAAEPVQRRDDECVALAEEIEGLPSTAPRVRVLAGLLVGEDSDAPVSSSWGGCTRQIVQKWVLLKFWSTSSF